MTSRSSTIIDDDEWLPNSHAGDLLLSEFMEPLGLRQHELAEAIGVNAGRINEVIAGTARITGELDLRLTRYFRMSEGFFLRLQDEYELREAKRRLNGELDRIIPRAA